MRRFTKPIILIAASMPSADLPFVRALQGYARCFRRLPDQRTVPDGAIATTKATGSILANRGNEMPVTSTRELGNPHQREHWLTAVFTLAQFRRTAGYKSKSSLERFHQYHRSILFAYNRSATRQMDALVDGCSDIAMARALSSYRSGFLRCFRRQVRPSAMIEAFAPAVDYYRQFLTRQNLRRYDDTSEFVLSKEAPVAELRKLIQVWAVRYDKRYVRDHALYRPYPAILIDV